MPNLATGHEHKLVMELQNSDYLTEHWTWRKNGKDTEMIYHFTRSDPAGQSCTREAVKCRDLE